MRTATEENDFQFMKLVEFLKKKPGPNAAAMVRALEHVWDGRAAANQRVGELDSAALEIREIIERVDNRCMAVDGPVTPTLEEMTQKEMSAIYAAAGGVPG